MYLSIPVNFRENLYPPTKTVRTMKWEVSLLADQDWIVLPNMAHSCPKGLT